MPTLKYKNPSTGVWETITNWPPPNTTIINTKATVSLTAPWAELLSPRNGNYVTRVGDIVVFEGGVVATSDVTVPSLGKVPVCTLPVGFRPVHTIDTPMIVWWYGPSYDTFIIEINAAGLVEFCNYTSDVGILATDGIVVFNVSFRGA